MLCHHLREDSKQGGLCLRSGSSDEDKKKQTALERLKIQDLLAT